MCILTEEQKEQIDEALSYIRGVRDVLEMHELRLDKFADVKANPSDPYGIDVAEATNAIGLARENLVDALDVLHEFDDAKVEEGK